MMARSLESVLKYHLSFNTTHGQPCLVCSKPWWSTEAPLCAELNVIVWSADIHRVVDVRRGCGFVSSIHRAAGVRMASFATPLPGAQSPRLSTWQAAKLRRHKIVVFVLTFFSYTAFHCTRKVFSVIKSNVRSCATVTRLCVSSPSHACDLCLWSRHTSRNPCAAE